MLKAYYGLLILVSHPWRRWISVGTRYEPRSRARSASGE